ncbi:MAG TPA: hypothetical protein VFT04_09135 [Gemmatimonadales bacterium]|nr:hypothetical protein [Gemmatimonadales bacterium]
MKRLTDRMELSLQMVHAFAAAFTIAFGVGLMFAIGRGREHLAGRLLVAIVACAALGGIDTAATRLAQRRRPLLAPDPPAYRRFAVWTAVGSLGAWVLLLATAWLL